jgi:hypothetical protein
VFDLLSAGDDNGVAQRTLRRLVHHGFALMKEAFHALASLGRRPFAEFAERLVHTHPMRPRFAKVFLKGYLQWLGRRSCRHQRKRIDQLFLGIPYISQFFHEMGPQRLDGSHLSSCVAAWSGRAQAQCCNEDARTDIVTVQ